MLEGRSNLARPTNWLLYGLTGGNQSYTGKIVSEESALSSSAVWAAVRILSETIASLPLHLYRRLERGKERATDHPLYNVLHIKPNPEMTTFTYRETMAGNILLHGNSYSEIERDEVNRVKHLWPLLSNKMVMKRDANTKQLYYVYALPGGAIKVFFPNQILHISGFGPDGLTGYNPITKGQEVIGLSMALEEFGARWFGNGARPAAVMQHPGQLGDKAQERLKKAWNEAHEGLSNAHRLAILEEGMTLTKYGLSPVESQAIESRKFQVVEVARLFNIPVHMLKDLDRATFSNIEMMSLEFVIYTLRPWLVRFEQNYTTQLLREDELKDYFFEHLVDGLLRGDTETRNRGYATARQWGWMSANDILELENRNPIEGGDEYLIPLNMISASQAGQIPTKKVLPEKKEITTQIETRSLPIGRDRVQASYHRLFLEAAKRIVNREGLAIKKSIKKHLGQRNLNYFNQWMDEFYGELPEYIKKAFVPVLMSYAEAIQSESAREIGTDVGMTPGLELFVTEYLDNYSYRHIQSSVGQLQQLIGESDPDTWEQIIEKRADEWGETRPEKIASNETARGANAIASFVFFAAGLGAIWTIRGAKTCPYCRSLNGKRIRSGGFFVQAGTDLKVDGEEQPMKITGLRRHPPLHAGCDCVLMPG